MRFLPGLTSTKPERMPDFLRELRTAVASGELRDIALFPTCLDLAGRRALYAELEAIPGLRLPHVHLRSDMREEEIEWLEERFGVELFNVHASRSSHPWTGPRGPRDARIFIENADSVPLAEELEGYGGLCLDYAHWESGRLLGDPAYRDFEALARGTRTGCCHISAVRPGVRSAWGGFDHHVFEKVEDLAYVLRYREFLPAAWASLELENGLEEQLLAIRMLEGLLGEAETAASGPQ
jgi:hypothetical protein